MAGRHRSYVTGLLAGAALAAAWFVPLAQAAVSQDAAAKQIAERYEVEVLHLLKELFEKHDLIFMVGGSGLYIDALCHGIDDLPPAREIVRRVVEEARETLARLPEDPTAIDPLFPFQLAHEIQADNAAFFFWLTLALVALWGGSIVDAWRTSPSSDRNRRARL